ncbi:MAG: hypothetical protein U0V73_16580 [Acidimicrobiia bacterium]
MRETEGGRGRPIGAALVVAIALIIMPSSLAQATPAGTSSGSSSGPNVQITVPLPAPAGSRALSITCTGQIDYIHGSVHQPGTVNQVGRSWCSSPIVSIWIKISVYKVDSSGVHLMAQSPVLTDPLRVQGNAASAVSCGYWYGTIDIVWFWPWGYPPSGATLKSDPAIFGC